MNGLSTTKKKYILGLIIYLASFGIVIPIIFYKLKWFELLEVWVPNLDLLATALGFRWGPFNTGLFSFLYSPDPETDLQKWSTLIINYISLLGLTFVVARRTYRSKSIASGWSVAFIMLLFTYLLPNEYIAQACEWGFWVFSKKYTQLGEGTRERIAIFLGLLVALFFIFIEKIFLKAPVRTIEKYIKKVFAYFKISQKI